MDRPNAKCGGAGHAPHRGRGQGCSRRLFPLLLICAAPVSGQTGIPTISVDVNVVVLHATVRDRRGRFVCGLREKEFRVFEDGAPQQISFFGYEDVPVAVGLIVDNSGSMRPKKRNVTAAALAFIRASNPHDEMFVVNFNEQVSFGLPAGGPFSDSPAALEVALNRNPPTGKTALYDSIVAGLQHLGRSALEKKVLIVVSDGGDNASHHTLGQVLAAAARSNALIYTIGLFDENDMDRNPGVLKKIARASGGATFLPADPNQVVPVCERIAEEIRHQYTIAYAPADLKLDKTYHTVHVTACGPHGSRLLVRVREGYSAAPAGPTETRR